MTSTTSWTRLEPRCRDAEMSDALQARVHDPLWSLARQWQVGEFLGQDAGTPVSVRCRAEAAQLSGYHAGAIPDDAERAGEPYDSSAAPIEALVEGEAIDLHADRRAAAEAGQHFLRLLRTHGMAEYTDAYLRRYEFAPPTDDILDADSRRFLRLVAGRVPDGAGLHEDLAALARGPDGVPRELPREPVIAEADTDGITGVVAQWLNWYADVHGAPRRPSSWVADRMEHRFAVSASTNNGEVVLEAAEYPGGHLDWHSFDIAPGASLEGSADEPREIVCTAMPATVRYRGMPSSRWWEVEDARVDFGSVETAAEDLASLLFVEFALVYGNDWFTAPIELEIGSLCRIRSLVVTDTFGERTLIRSHRDVDGPDSPWRMFALDHRDGTEPTEELLFLPPTLPASLHGPTLEEVLLRRDEIANMGWAIERVVPSAIGSPLRRAEEGPAASQPGPEPAGSVSQAGFAYRLTTGVPDHWIPLVPVQTGPDTIRLRRGRLLGGASSQPRGEILDADGLSLFEEEVPRAGARVARRYQYSRWTDGSTHVWLARRKHIQGGEAWSGLRFDVVEPSASTHPNGPPP